MAIWTNAGCWTRRFGSRLLLGCAAGLFVGLADRTSGVEPIRAVADAQTGQVAEAVRPPDRPASIRAIADRVGIGAGSTVADIGAGRGIDTWVFAERVGASGIVYAVEIGEDKVQALRDEADKRQQAQVRPVLGSPESPQLPQRGIDLAYMRYVYHHVSRPREMLREIWRSLKPGGYFVVVDRLPGTLRDWVPREVRTEKHFWLAETTVVREAREEGFCFVACADELCESKDRPFVLIFQRPVGVAEPGQDPDPFQPLAIRELAQTLLGPEARVQRPAIVALGQAREVIPAILARSSGAGIEIVLEEWATQKDERPPLPADVTLPSVLTDLGVADLGPDPVDAVVFLDTYHLLFHGPAVLKTLYERLAPGGRVVVLDRAATKPLSRREASHRRQIALEVVKRELAAAGFVWQSTGPPPAADRFLLVFSKPQSP